MQRDKEMTIRIPKEMEQDFRLFIVLHGGQILNKEEIRPLEIYREDYNKVQFDEILNVLNLNDNEVGEAFMVHAVVDKSTLKQ